MTIPGSGKTVLKEAIGKEFSPINLEAEINKSGNIKFLHLSSDDIRAELMEAKMEENGGDRDKAFEATAKPAKQAFDKRFSEIIDEVIEDQEHTGYAIFVDKNVLPNQFSGLRKQFSEFGKRLSAQDIESSTTLLLPN